MIWIKRLAPFVVLAAIWFIYSAVESHNQQVAEETDLRVATVSAHLFVASALYREDPQRYYDYRDSVLIEFKSTPEEIEGYPKLYDGNPEAFQNFTKLLERMVDSLIKLEDSTLNQAMNDADSAARAVMPKGIFGVGIIDTIGK